MPCPYDGNNPMNMIGHDHAFIHFYIGEMDQDIIPTFLDHPPRIIQPHFPIHDFAEQTFPILGADGDEIRPVLGIIVSMQTDRTTFLGRRINKGHRCCVSRMKWWGSNRQRVHRIARFDGGDGRDCGVARHGGVDNVGARHAVPLHGETNLFIYPPYKFKLTDMLLTNFHLPKTTLLMLVAAFCGYDLMKEAYRQAIEKRYRLFSYGDAMLIV